MDPEEIAKRIALAAEQQAAFDALSDEQRTELMKSAREQVIRCDFEIEKGYVDIEKRQVTTPVMTAWEPDLHGQRMLPEEISDALDTYMLGYQLVGRMHTELTNNVPVRAWFDGYQAYLTIQVVDDKDWRAITDGVYKGTSWAGLAQVVSVNEELSQALGIPAGEWLFDIEMIEDSLVDMPAVPNAVFKSDAAPPETLVQQVRAGKVAPRVLAPTKKKQKKGPACTPKGIGNGLHSFMAAIYNYITRPKEGGTNTEDTDMGLTPEERAELDALTKSMTDLGGKVNQLVEASKAKTEKTEPESTTEETPPTPEELIKAATEPLQEQIRLQNEEIEKLKNKPMPTAVLREEEEATKKVQVPYSSLPPGDPEREKGLGRR